MPKSRLRIGICFLNMSVSTSQSITPSRMAQIALLAVNVFLTGLLLYLWRIQFLYAVVNTDAGYYLATVKRLSEGFELYSELPGVYTPLSFYVLYVPALLFKDPPYEAYLAVLLVINLLSAFLLYRLLFFVLNSPSVRYLLSITFLYSVYLAEGTGIVIEPVALLFCLWALFLSLESKFALSGIAAALAFLSKQYGLAIVPAIFVLFFEGGFRISRPLKFSLGFLGTVVFAFLYFYSAREVDTFTLLSLLYGSGYEARPGSLSIFSKNLRLIMPYLFITLVVLIFAIKQKCSLRIISLVLAFMPFLLTCTVRPYKHYLILAIPFALILTGFAVSFLLSRIERNTARILSTAVLICLFFQILLVHYRTMRYAGKVRRFSSKELEFKLGNTFKSILPKGKDVILFANPKFLYLADLYPPKSLMEGYAFLNNLEPSKIIRGVESADFVLIDRKNAEYREPLSSSGVDIYAILEREKYERLVTVNEQYEIWKRRI